MLVLFFTGNGKVIHRAGDPGGPSKTSASLLSLSGAKSSKAGIRVDKLEDIVGDSQEAEIANYLDDKMTCVNFACVGDPHLSSSSLTTFPSTADVEPKVPSVENPKLSKV